MRIVSPSLSGLILRDDFCGMGGWSIGFHRAGFRCLGLDIIDVGYPYEFIHSDIRDFDAKPWAKVRDRLVVVSSPPCTEFSDLTILSWKKGQRGPPDPDKGLELVRHAIRVIEECRPRYWILENVKGAVEYISPLLGEPKLIARPWVLWGQFPEIEISTSKGESQKSVGIYIKGSGGYRSSLVGDFAWNPLRSWLRARLPVFVSEMIARSVLGEMNGKGSKTIRLSDYA